MCSSDLDPRVIEEFSLGGLGSLFLLLEVDSKCSVVHEPVRDGPGGNSNRLVSWGGIGSDWLAFLAAGSSRLGAIEEKMDRGC